MCQGRQLTARDVTQESVTEEKKTLDLKARKMWVNEDQTAHTHLPLCRHC